jgi:hypothetical protein
MASLLEADLERVCKLLEQATPEAMDAGGVALEAIVRQLSEQQASVTVEEARRLRTLARRARLLLDLAARFHSRCYDILAGMTGGYTSQGALAGYAVRGRISYSA